MNRFKNFAPSRNGLRRGMLALPALTLACLAMLTPACGGGSGGSEAGRGLALLNFINASVDNTALNQRLEFVFSADVDPASVNNATIQIREGPAFGTATTGVFVVQGSSVVFEPQLAGLCDQSDSGLKPDTQYRVQVIGLPEEFSVRNTAGQALGGTQTFEFHTRLDTDPNKYDDQIPGVGPLVTNATPTEGSDAVTVAAGNRVVLDISENLDPCTVNDQNILFYMYETGGVNINAPAVAPNPNLSGFSSDGTNTGDTTDQDKNDPYTWGAVGSVTLPQPQKLLADIELIQSFNATQIIITPTSGSFPENALIVVELTPGIVDYGQQLMTPYQLSFTTQNLAGVDGTYTVRNEGETPWNPGLSTADVNTARAPGLVQGYMLFAGDGDNGGDQLTPTYPANPTTCATRSNSGTKDNFDPTADVLLDTGASTNCINATDGSTAVIWEFASMHIRNGLTVRVVGKNPAIFLVQGDVVIENGGTLKARGTSSSDSGNGQNGGAYQSGNGNGLTDRAGGKGVAGGGNGGIAEEADQNHRYSDDGNPGFSSTDYNPAMPRISPATTSPADAPVGGGASGQPLGANTSSSPWDGCSAGGGGGGHTEAGEDGSSNDPGTNYTLKLDKRSFGGEAYEANGNSSDKLQTPEAGSGGGGAGLANARTFNTSTTYCSTGGAGGAGGGFIDITSSGNIDVYGTIDVAGGRGGNGAAWVNRIASGGGGGGSGGGLRLLTPNDITLSATAVVSAAGGAGGLGAVPGTASAQNNGGAGSNGRIVMETNNGIISGLASAGVTPTEGEAGFYRGTFDATRFQGGGLEPQAVSDLFAVGPFNPIFLTPIANDFVAGVPTGSSPGTGMTAILIEAQGYPMKPDATPDTGAPTGWYTVGHFVDSGVDTAPTWLTTAPSGAQLPAGVPGDNVGTGINNLDTMEFIQLRITIYLNSSIGPFDPGGYIDTWMINFTSDQ
jgi:hypothetical protein